MTSLAPNSDDLPLSKPEPGQPAKRKTAAKADAASQGDKPKAKASGNAKSSSSEKLAKLGLRKDMDFILHLPLRYEDETEIVPINQAAWRVGHNQQVEGIVQSAEVENRPRRQLLVTLADDSGQITLRFLHFYGSQVTQLQVGAKVRARAEIRHGFFGAEMVHPTYKLVQDDTPLPTALTPVYPASAGVPQALLRKAIANALQRARLDDTLSAAQLAALGLPGFAESVRYLHHPPPAADLHSLSEHEHPAWQRIKFDELLAQQLSLKRAQAKRRAQRAPSMPQIARYTEGFLANLPFALTGAQQRVLTEIRADLACAHPMQRLLQGDVGSGKTIVAALAATQAIDNGFQAALMAPTEILAEQHFRKIASWLEPLGIRSAWLSGSQKKKDKQAALAMIASGEAHLVIGTHALLQEQVVFQNLGLVLVDEQHRFGVDQRLELANKTPAGLVPHQLMMSATPIPRTLAMTYFADLEVSVIDELPPGRSPIITRVIDQNRRDEVIARVGAAAAEGKQIYWVCPLIEESEALQLQTATDTLAMLQEALPGVSVALVHGRLKPAEKQQIMADFLDKRSQVLVATTVIEVGVDVPNASLMVIEHAERFGLAQLHQLRGRVGRGAVASVCLLLYQGPLGMIAKQRLAMMRESQDGFAIARKDLELRGPGEFLGARQSGEALLRFANLETDEHLAEAAAELASQLLHTQPEVVAAHLQRWMGQREDYLRV